MKIRLDKLLTERGLASSRDRAQAMILAGRVLVDEQKIEKPGHSVAETAAVRVLGDDPRYVSRGGIKLEAALRHWEINLGGKICIDVGASTGGFTDCLLQRGASNVTAIDVGYGQLDWRLRNDPRVRVMERTNFRRLADDAFPAGFDLIVIDASFISLRTILARAAVYLRESGAVVALIKPQFEAGRERVASGGVVRDRRTHVAVLRDLRAAAVALGLRPVALIASPLLGPAGNREFLIELRRGAGTPFGDARIEAVLDEEKPR